MIASRNIPTVNIGMPVYNAENYLQGALDSLLAQDYGDFDLLISDNASTDRTQEICLDYTARDRRVRYQRNGRNIGAADNFNRVLEPACGKYFMWAAHDDYKSGRSRSTVSQGISFCREHLWAAPHQNAQTGHAGAKDSWS